MHIDYVFESKLIDQNGSFQGWGHLVQFKVLPYMVSNGNFLLMITEIEDFGCSHISKRALSAGCRKKSSDV